MLTGRLVRVRFARDRIIPGYVDASAPEWQEVAERLLELFRGHAGHTRGEIDEDVKDTFGSDPQQLIHQGLAKLLEDRCEFEVVSGHPPEQLRERVFAAAATRRQEREVVLAEVAATLQMTPEAVAQGLFADLKSEQRLVKFKDTTAQRLLERYNLGLAQAVLLRSTGVRIDIRKETPQRYRQLLRLIKFHRLIADIERSGTDSYRIRLDGPLSLFSATQKYGLQLALFLPAVLNCRDFELEAELLWGPQRKQKVFTMGPRDGLVSHQPDTGMYVPPELGMFADLFRKKIAGWEIADETEILPLDKSFWVPDYRLTHKASGKQVYLEVLGFWRRASALKHLERLRSAQYPFILAVSDQLHIEEEDLEAIPAGIHRFRQMPLPDEIARLASEVARG